MPLLPAIAVLAMTANPARGPLDLEPALQLAAARNDEVAIRRAEVEAALADVAVANALRTVPQAHVTALVGPPRRPEGTWWRRPIRTANRCGTWGLSGAWKEPWSRRS